MLLRVLPEGKHNLSSTDDDCSGLTAYNSTRRNRKKRKGRGDSILKIQKCLVCDWPGQQLIASCLKIKSGECIGVKGKVMAEAKSFAFNLGQDASNLIIHFNPRFKYHRDTRTIVCNSKLDGKWGEEMWESEFPFQQGEEAKIEISFDAKEVTVKCLEDLNLKFPNRLGLEGVNYLSVEGDFEVHSLKFK